MNRHCQQRLPDGSLCRAAPLKDSEFCLFHSPEHKAEVAEARRLGGLRRRREVAVAGAYDFGGLGSVCDIRRLLEVAVLDVLSLENSVARARTLAYLAQTALKALQLGEMEERLAALEAAVLDREPSPTCDFDLDLEPIDDDTKDATDWHRAAGQAGSPPQARWRPVGTYSPLRLQPEEMVDEKRRPDECLQEGKHNRPEAVCLLKIEHHSADHSQEVGASSGCLTSPARTAHRSRPPRSTSIRSWTAPGTPAASPCRLRPRRHQHHSRRFSRRSGLPMHGAQRPNTSRLVIDTKNRW